MDTVQEGASQSRPGQALSQIKAKRRFKVSLLIYLAVNAVLLLTWAGLAIAGVPVNSGQSRAGTLAIGTGGNVAIYAAAMVIWGAFVAVSGYRAYHGHAHRDHAYSEEQIQRELNKLP